MATNPPNVIYQICQAEDGSVALAGPDGELITYKSDWGDLIYWFREAHWPEHPAHQDNAPALVVIFLLSLIAMAILIGLSTGGWMA